MLYIGTSRIPSALKLDQEQSHLGRAVAQPSTSHAGLRAGLYSELLFLFEFY